MGLGQQLLWDGEPSCLLHLCDRALVSDTRPVNLTCGVQFQIFFKFDLHFSEGPATFDRCVLASADLRLARVVIRIVLLLNLEPLSA